MIPLSKLNRFKSHVTYRIRAGEKHPFSQSPKFQTDKNPENFKFLKFQKFSPVPDTTGSAEVILFSSIKIIFFIFLEKL